MFVINRVNPLNSGPSVSKMLFTIRRYPPFKNYSVWTLKRIVYTNYTPKWTILTLGGICFLEVSSAKGGFTEYMNIRTVYWYRVTWYIRVTYMFCVVCDSTLYFIYKHVRINNIQVHNAKFVFNCLINQTCDYL